MRQVGELWVWSEPQQHRLVLGNRAAAEEARGRGTAARRPIESVQAEVASAPARCTAALKHIGRFQVPNGRVIALRVGTDLDTRPLWHIVARLATDAPVDEQLDYELTPEGRHRLWVDGRLAMDWQPIEDSALLALWNNPFVYLLSEMVLRLMSHQPLMAILHGASVVWRGKRIIFVGASGAGKSTLAAMLVGAAYLSDDNVAISTSGDLVPIPLAPSLKEGSWPLVEAYFPQLTNAQVFYKRARPLKYLHDAPFSAQGGPPDLLVFPMFSVEASPKLVRLSPIEVLLHISQAGMWILPENLEPFLDMLDGLPAVAMRHGPDLNRTQEMIAEQLSA